MPGSRLHGCGGMRLRHFGKRFPCLPAAISSCDAFGGFLPLLQEESAFEKRIRNYEYAAVASIVIFLLCFFTVPFVKDRIQ